MDFIVYLVGPTGSGKTSLATHLAKKISGELISADSVQVYRGLDIISGKDIDKDSIFTEIKKVKILTIGNHKINGIPTYLLDIVDPSYSFHISDFYLCANEAIEIVRESGKLPIVVGGSTLYVKSLLNPVDTINIPANLNLRKELEEKALLHLQKKLRKISPSLYLSLNQSELGNKRRLIRKIEIELAGKNHIQKGAIIQRALVFGLYCQIEQLRERIDIRVEQRIKNGGLEEVEALFKRYQTVSPQVQNANGYKQLFAYFMGEDSREVAIQKWKYSEYRHAKNQMTYFKKYLDAEWFNIMEDGFEKVIEEKILRTIRM